MGPYHSMRVEGEWTWFNSPFFCSLGLSVASWKFQQCLSSRDKGGGSQNSSVYFDHERSWNEEPVTASVRGILLNEVVWICWLGMSNFLANFWDSKNPVSAQIGIKEERSWRTLSHSSPVKVRLGIPEAKEIKLMFHVTLAYCPWNT